METPQEGGEEQVEETIDVFSTDKSDKGGEEQRQAVERQEPAREPARDNDRQEERADSRDQDDERDARDRDPPRRRDESDDDYSRRVRGRINRERALRLKETRKVDDLTIANQELRDRLSRVERRQKAEDITGEAAKKISEINAKIETTKTKLAAAIEAGDTAKQLEINIELAELVADKKIYERRSEYQAQQVREAAEAGEGGQDQGDPDQARIDRAVSKWRTQNRNWFNLRRFSDVRADAVELDKELRQEVSAGRLDMQEYSDEYFAELSARLKDLYPDLDVRGLDGDRIEAESEDLDRDARNSRDDDRDLERGRGRGDRDRDDRGSRRPAPRRHPSGNMGSGDRRRGPNDARQLAEQGRVRLSNADYAQMRQYGLDPNDPEQKKEFAKERMRTIMTQGRDDQRGGGR
jgi:hypothetical protein